MREPATYGGQCWRTRRLRAYGLPMKLWRQRRTLRERRRALAGTKPGRAVAVFDAVTSSQAASLPSVSLPGCAGGQQASRQAQKAAPVTPPACPAFGSRPQGARPARLPFGWSDTEGRLA